MEYIVKINAIQNIRWYLAYKVKIINYKKVKIADNIIVTGYFIVSSTI